MTATTKHFMDYLESSIAKNWSSPALSDFDGNANYTYGEMAKTIARLHLLFAESGIAQGDKIALCGRNCANWAISFLAVTSYGGVAVSILPDFKAESVHALVNHSDAKLLFVGNSVWKELNTNEMPNLYGILSIENFELKDIKSEKLKLAHEQWDETFGARYANGFTVDDVKYTHFDMESPALINYTSGTTSDPKGVVVPWRSLSSNVQFGQDRIPNHAGWNMVSMLPLAHMFGLTFEFVYQLAGGCHVYFLSKTPSPQILMKAFAEVHPYMILTVPLVIEKIFKSKIFPALQKPLVRIMWNTPGLNLIVRKKVREQLMNAFGGELKYLIIGGAALNKEVEKCLHKIKFPYCIGYGMTECGPLIGYEDWFRFKQGSCGKIVHRNEIRIDSENEQKVVGEIMVKGENVMLGYYKNEEATKAIFTEDGWMRTGDLGVIDKQGNIFIRGRSKNMILGPSGQNIYPEEIEDKVNNLPYVIESVVVSRDNKLVALVYIDTEAIAKEQPEKNAAEIMEQNRLAVNKIMPGYCGISAFEIVKEEFEKTPKRSIKRFLYK